METSQIFHDKSNTAFLTKLMSLIQSDTGPRLHSLDQNPDVHKLNVAKQISYLSSGQIRRPPDRSMKTLNDELDTQLVTGYSVVFYQNCYVFKIVKNIRYLILSE